jgi:hypothetical protein
MEMTMDMANINCNNESPIFIGGSKRGGTTLLRRIINAHSQIMIPPPEWIFHFVYMHLYSYGSLQKDENILALIKDCLGIPFIKKYWNISETDEDILALLPEKSFRGLYTAFFYLSLRKSKKLFWGAKTPSNVFWFKEIQNMFPKARFILLYRDGRDVSIDLTDVNWGPNNLYTACLLWQNYTQAMIRSKEYLEPKNYYEMYYEKLVTDPEKEINELCEFLEVQFEKQMITFYQNTEEKFLKQSSHKKANQPITSDYVGIHNNLSVRDRQLQISVIGDTLKQLNYHVEEEPREIGFWEKAWYLEEDRHGGTVLEGGVEYKNNAKAQRTTRRQQKVWSASDKELQYIQSL